MDIVSHKYIKETEIPLSGFSSMLERCMLTPCTSGYLSTRLASYITHNNYYKILGVKSNATAEEIKEAFVKKSNQLHPDGNQMKKDSRINWGREDSTEKFMLVKEAYDCLRKPEKRKAYDEGHSTDGFLFEVKSSNFNKDDSVINLNKQRTESYMGPGRKESFGQHFRDPEKEYDAELKKNNFLKMIGFTVFMLIVCNIGYVNWMRKKKLEKS
ncbi:unnamed protein product [Auanema sp. JU1783]|nr:unnamed protein product [Auanema sp. JU1783]